MTLQVVGAPLAAPNAGAPPKGLPCVRPELVSVVITRSAATKQSGSRFLGGETASRHRTYFCSGVHSFLRSFHPTSLMPNSPMSFRVVSAVKNS